MATPTPKPLEERRNTSAPRRGEWVDLPASGTFKAVLPALPKKDPYGGAWPTATKRAWEAWRKDPVTTQYSEADIDYALDTIFLHTLMQDEPKRYASEVSKRMNDLGLTPSGKRALRFRLPQFAEAQEQVESKKRQNKRSKDRRAQLEVVKVDAV